MRADLRPLLCVLDALARPASVAELAAITKLSDRRVREMLADAHENGDARVADGRHRRYVTVLNDAEPFAYEERERAARAIAGWLERNGGRHAEVAQWWVRAHDGERARGFFDAAAVDAELHGDPLAALDALERALAFAPGARERTALHRRAAVQERRLGRFAGAESRLRALLEEAPVDADDTARTALALARVRLTLADAAGVEAAAAQAAATASDPELGFHARALRSYVVFARGERAHLPALREELARASAIERVAASRALRGGGAPLSALAVIDDVLARPLPFETEVLARLEAVRSLLWCVKLGEARQRADEAAAWAGQIGDDVARAGFTVEYAWLAALAGDREEAVARLAAAAGSPALSPILAPVRLAAEIEVALAADDLVRVEILLDGAALARALGSGFLDELERLAAAFARGHRALGNLADARRVLDETLARVPRGALVPLLVIEAALVRDALVKQPLAALVRANGRNESELYSAHRDFSFAADPMRPLETRTRLSRTATATFARFGWHVHARRAAQLANGVSLSPRRAQVAALAAAGYSNAQIAQRLDISQHTVQHHMSAILRELGLRSRWQLKEPKS